MRDPSSTAPSLALVLAVCGLCLCLCACGGTASRRLGEVYVFKAVPRDAVLTSNRSRAVYMLRGPGYPASENANRLFDLFNDFGHLGPLVLIAEAERLGEEADRAYQLAIDRGEANNPATKALSEIALQSWQISDELRGKVLAAEIERIEGDPGTRDTKLEEQTRRRQAIKRLHAVQARERELTAAVAALLQTRVSLRQHGQDLKDLYNELYRDNVWIPWPARKQYLGTKYPLFLKFGGQPLPNDSWTYLDQAGPQWDQDWTYIKADGRRSRVQSRPKFVIDENFVDYLHLALPPAPRWSADAEGARAPDETDRRANHQLETIYGQMATGLHDIAERSLLLQQGLQYQWERLPRLSYVSESDRRLIEHERLRLDVSPLFAGYVEPQPGSIAGPAAAVPSDQVQHPLRVIETMPYKRMINEIQARIRSSISLADRILGFHAEEMREIARDYVDAKVRIEVMAYRFDQIVPRHPNRRLQVVNDPKLPPTRLTVLLKTLYIRYLDEGEIAQPPERRGAELLVTAEFQTADDVASASGQVTPVVFEPHYSPGLFVNVRDRIVYGPRTYKGQFFNVRLSVVELDGLANTAISNGLSLAIDAVAKFQPELTAVSPFVSAFFRGVLNALNQDDVELKFEFTIPGPEGKGKADVDLLLAETGHYVVMKRENPERNEYHPEKARRRYTDNDLIYDPEDGLLYYRKDMENPANNFTPENLFREQTYMVLVVTDEYAQEDRLGEALRKSLATSLGEERARELVPDHATTLDLLDNLDRLTTQLAPAGVDLPEGDQRTRHLQVERRQEELWSSTSDLNKAMIIRGLSESATDRARQTLGTDLEAWKQANLVIREDGKIDIR